MCRNQNEEPEKTSGHTRNEKKQSNNKIREMDKGKKNVMESALG